MSVRLYWAPEPMKFEGVALVMTKSERVRPVTGWEAAIWTVKGPVSVVAAVVRVMAGATTAAVPVIWTLSKVAVARALVSEDVVARPMRTWAGRPVRVVVPIWVQAVPLAEAKDVRVLPERTRRT